MWLQDCITGVTSCHQFKIQYQKSSDHGNADALSRLSIKEQCEEEEVEKTINYIVTEQLAPMPVTAAQIKLFRKQIARWPKYQSTTNCNIRKAWISAARWQRFSTLFKKPEEYSLVQDIFMWWTRVEVPSVLRGKILQQFHDFHLGIVKMKSLARNYVWWSHMDQDIEDLNKSCA